jgi:hypothetical protein
VPGTPHVEGRYGYQGRHRRRLARGGKRKKPFHGGSANFGDEANLGRERCLSLYQNPYDPTFLLFFMMMTFALFVTICFWTLLLALAQVKAFTLTLTLTPRLSLSVLSRFLLTPLVSSQRHPAT